MDKVDIFIVEALKHLQGKHNQKRHGWRYGDNYQPARNDEDSAEYHNRGLRKSSDREHYQKVRSMVESDNFLGFQSADDVLNYSKNLYRQAMDLKKSGAAKDRELPEGYTSAQTMNARTVLGQARAAKRVAEEVAAGKIAIGKSKIKVSRPKPVKPPSEKRGTGDSSKVDPSLARNAYRMAKGDIKAAYSRVVQLTGLKPGFDAKDLYAWFRENGYK